MDDFEAVCCYWEETLKRFVDQLSDGTIPTLREAQWLYEKKRISIYPADEEGIKPRGAQGPGYRSYTQLNRYAADEIWRLFKPFAEEHGLNKIDRLRNNEKELGWFDFQAENTLTSDHLYCSIYLQGEWRTAELSIRMFIGPRYRKMDIE